LCTARRAWPAPESQKDLVVVGWRCWELHSDDVRLVSMTPDAPDTPWTPRTELPAQCPTASHTPPNPECTCGIYAARDIRAGVDMCSDIGSDSADSVPVFGCVALWGKLLEPRQGWRAGRGYPLILFVPSTTTAQVRRALAETYGIPVHTVPFQYREAFQNPDVVRQAEGLRRQLEGIQAEPYETSFHNTMNEGAANIGAHLEKEHERLRRQEQDRERLKENEELFSRTFGESGWLTVHSAAPVKRTPDAKVGFLPGWRHVQVGEIRAGTELLIAYDRRRWPRCPSDDHPHQDHPGRPDSVSIRFRFHPHGEEVTHQLHQGAVVVEVPTHACSIELWFKGDHMGHHHWDSRYGQNYWFDIARP